MSKGKNITLILILVTVVSLLLAVTFAAKRKEALDKYAALEAQVNKLMVQNQALESSLKETVAKLQEAQATTDNLKTALAQEQLKNQSLTTELEKVTQVKAALEEKISQSNTSALPVLNQPKTGKK